MLSISLVFSSVWPNCGNTSIVNEASALLFSKGSRSSKRSKVGSLSVPYFTAWRMTAVFQQFLVNSLLFPAFFEFRLLCKLVIYFVCRRHPNNNINFTIQTLFIFLCVPRWKFLLYYIFSSWIDGQIQELEYICHVLWYTCDQNIFFFQRIHNRSFDYEEYSWSLKLEHHEINLTFYVKILRTRKQPF